MTDIHQAFSRQGSGILASVELGLEHDMLSLDGSATLVREDSSWRMWPQSKLWQRLVKANFAVLTYATLVPFVAYVVHQRLHGRAVSIIILCVVVVLCAAYIVYVVVGVKKKQNAKQKYAFGVAWDTKNVEQAAVCTYPQDGFTNSRHKFGDGDRCGYHFAPTRAVVAFALVISSFVVFLVARRFTDTQTALVASGALAGFLAWGFWLYVAVSSASFNDPVSCDTSSSPCLANLLELQEMSYGCPATGLLYWVSTVVSLVYVSIAAFLSWSFLPSSLKRTQRVGATFILATVLAASIGLIRGNPLLGPFNGACDTMNEVVLRPSPGGLDVTIENYNQVYFERNNMVMPNTPIMVVQGGKIQDIVPKAELNRQNNFYSSLTPPISSVLVFNYRNEDSKPTLTTEQFTELLKLYD